MRNTLNELENNILNEINENNPDSLNYFRNQITSNTNINNFNISIAELTDTFHNKRLLNIHITDNIYSVLLNRLINRFCQQHSIIDKEDIPDIDNILSGIFKMELIFLKHANNFDINANSDIVYTRYINARDSFISNGSEFTTLMIDIGSGDINDLYNSLSSRLPQQIITEQTGQNSNIAHAPARNRPESNTPARNRPESNTPARNRPESNTPANIRNNDPNWHLGQMFNYSYNKQWSTTAHLIGTTVLTVAYFFAQYTPLYFALKHATRNDKDSDQEINTIMKPLITLSIGFAITGAILTINRAETGNIYRKRTGQSNDIEMGRINQHRLVQTPSQSLTVTTNTPSIETHFVTAYTNNNELLRFTNQHRELSNNQSFASTSTSKNIKSTQNNDFSHTI